MLKIFAIFLMLSSLSVIADIAQNTFAKVLPSNLGIHIKVGDDETGRYSLAEVVVDESLVKCLSLNEIGIYRADNLKIISSAKIGESTSIKRKMKFSYALNEEELNQSRLMLFFNYVKNESVEKELDQWCRSIAYSEIVFELPKKINKTSTLLLIVEGVKLVPKIKVVSA